MAKQKLFEELKREQTKKPLFLLSSGSTLLNLHCSGTANGCYPAGAYTHLVGDSDSGKTVIALTSLAEASIDGRFKDYRFIYRCAETASMMDFAKFFGQSASERIEIYRCSTLEQFFDDLSDDFDKKKPFIEILDSVDAITTVDEQDKFEEEKRARETGKNSPGSYGTAKAKGMSANLRIAANRLEDSASILILISQTRDNIGFGSQFNPKVYSGGNALKFYSSLQLWSSTRSEIKKHYKGKEYQQGIKCKIKITKNHVSGRKGDIEIPLYWSTGLDDLGSQIDFLIEIGHWKKSKEDRKEAITAPEFDYEGKIEDFIQKIDSEGKHLLLREITNKAWDEIEEACKVNRSSKYK
jgi:RecA/RadA recombinase